MSVKNNKSEMILNKQQAKWDCGKNIFDSLAEGQQEAIRDYLSKPNRPIKRESFDSFLDKIISGSTASDKK